MAEAHSKEVVLAERPVGIPEARHFEVREAPMPEAGDGEILIRNRFLSVDPAMRGWVNTWPIIPSQWVSAR